MVERHAKNRGDKGQKTLSDFPDLAALQRKHDEEMAAEQRRHEKELAEQ